MFSFASTPVTFMGLLVLFAWCTAWSGYELTRPQDVRQRISNLLHLGMAAVMLVMVAPITWNLLTMLVPTFVLAGAFAACVVWFGWLAVDAGRSRDRSGMLHFSGHAAMFAAMAWHLSAMGVMEAAMAQGMDAGSDMGGMDAGGMSGMDWMTAQSMPGGTLWTLALVGLPLMVYLLASSLRSVWLAAQRSDPAASTCPCGPECDCGPSCSCYAGHAHAAAPEPELVAAGTIPIAHIPTTPTPSAHTCHEVRPVGSGKFRLENLAAFAMNFGMFWMSAGLLAPILPFMAALAF